MDVRNLRGKTALVTGAGSGIGRATAMAFAERGADLMLCDLDKEGLDDAVAQANALGKGRAQGHAVDVADAAQMEAFAAAVHGQIPICTLLAAVNHTMGNNPQHSLAQLFFKSIHHRQYQHQHGNPEYQTRD